MKFLTILALLPAAALMAADYKADVVVYGGTSGGVTAAAAAAREGKSVLLLEPGSHLGGMTASGLGNVDIMRQETLGGLTAAFLRRSADRPDGAFNHATPAYSEQLFDAMVAVPGVTVVKNARLAEKSKPKMADGRILSVKLENGDTVSGKIFVDATYEGDLMAAAGVSYRVGREGRNEYGESAAGIRPAIEIKHAEAFDDNGNLLPDLVRAEPGKVGDADGLTQAYNFRVCMTQNKDNFVPVPKPEGYNPANYRNLLNWIKSEPDKKWTFNDIISYWGLLPDGKIDVNNRGDFSTDMINHSHTWSEVSYAERDAIAEDHKRYIQGLLYFISHDPGVPADLREDASSWGLPADEFPDNGHWPWQLYVRESRRMVGDYVMRQQDCYEDNLKPDSIGIGSYMLDSHAVRKFLAPDGKVYMEGFISVFDGKVPVRPYEIPYRALTPRKSECVNLLVPVCLSASHVAYCSLRMEPQFMTAGEAAGIAAAMAIDKNCPVQDIDTDTLQKRLESLGGILHYPGGNLFPRTSELEKDGYYVLDDPDAELSGPWQNREVGTPMLNGRYKQSYTEEPVTATYHWTVPEDGRYILYLLVPHGEIRKRMPVTFMKNRTTYKLSCDLSATDKGLLDEMHRFIAKKGDKITVVVGNGGRDVKAVADGVVFKKIK